MKKLIFTAIFALLSSCAPAYAQTAFTAQTVSVSDGDGFTFRHSDGNRDLASDFWTIRLIER